MKNPFPPIPPLPLPTVIGHTLTKRTPLEQTAAAAATIVSAATVGAGTPLLLFSLGFRVSF